MEVIYYLLFGVLAVAAAFLELSRGKETGHGSMTPEFLSFRNNYVVVYSLMMGTDLLYRFVFFSIASAVILHILLCEYVSCLQCTRAISSGVEDVPQ